MSAAALLFVGTAERGASRGGAVAVLSHVGFSRKFFTILQGHREATIKMSKPKKIQ